MPAATSEYYYNKYIVLNLLWSPLSLRYPVYYIISLQSEALNWILYYFFEIIYDIRLQ